MIARQLYALGLLLGVLVLVLAPVHGALTEHHHVVRTLADGQVQLQLASGTVRVGQQLPIHRHNPDWVHPIGTATVTEVQGDRAVARYDPATFRWPMGRHGQVTGTSGEDVLVELGGAHELQLGDVLHAFDGDARAARLRVASTTERSVRAQVLEGPEASDLVGAPVSEYTLRTRASPLTARWLWVLETLILALALGLWTASWVHEAPGRWWRTVAGTARAGVGWLSARPGVRLAVHLALGAAVWWLVPLLFFSATAVAFALGNGLAALGVPLTAPPRFPDADLRWLQVPAVLAYVGWLGLRSSSPWLALWRAVAYRPLELRRFPLGKGFGLWILHLLIFAAFAATLTSFLAHNMTVVVQILWPSVDGSLLTLADARRTLGAIWGTAPVVRDGLALLEAFRFTLWSVTICGCLLGYGHTVLSILWKHPLQNLDFTLTGWFTNAICYGPLLGVVLLHQLPDDTYFGPDPIVTEGPLYVAVLGTELLLNVLYTASIWNLGVKFGVMADKGLRTTGFYAVVRHPSYTLEALLFVVMFCPALSTGTAWLAASTFFVKYWLRSEREDHFLSVSSDDDHADYRHQVPFKYVPGLF